MEILEGFINIAAPIFFISLTALIVFAFARNIYSTFHKITDWKKTTATMTGRTNMRVYRTRGGACYQFTEYEISYCVDGQTYHKYFDFSPGPDPVPPYTEGTILSIRYRMKRPQVFEVMDVVKDGRFE